MPEWLWRGVSYYVGWLSALINMFLILVSGWNDDRIKGMREQIRKEGYHV